MSTALIAYAINATRPLITSPVGIFLVVLMIMLVTPMIFNRLRIPTVIGLILAGVIAGPYGFNLLARDMSFEVFGQVGLLYLMFLAGIEIDMYHLKKNLRKGVVFGMFTFFIPLLLGTVAALTFLKLSLLTSVLLASMFAAHTLLAYPIVSRFGLTRQPAVVIAIAGTIFTVLGSLIVLAATVGVARDGSFEVMGILRLLGSLILYCLITVYIYPRLTRWFFKRYHETILQFIYVLAMVFLAAEMAVAIHIEAVFGAFYAGLVLNRYIPGKSPLMGRIEFVGNALFIPYFLIGVGMLINIKVLFTGWNTIYVATVMCATAMATKWLAAFATQKTFGMNAIDRSIMYQLSNAHTAVALAVVMIGFNLGIFEETILDGTIVMILVTCTVSSLGTSRAASKLKVMSLTKEEILTGENAKDKSRISNVLIPVANPESATELVNLAVMMQPADSRARHLYALHVRNDNSAQSRAVGRSSLDTAEQVAASVDLRLEPVERYDYNFVTGVLNAIHERDITEVVIGLHRRTMVLDSFLGDKLEQLLKATYRMISISRCFIPINTVTRVVVAVPPKAEYETGFRQWVEALGNITRQLGCRIIFCCTTATAGAIKAVLRSGAFEIRAEFRPLEQMDDFVLLANKILDDDLMVVVSSRRASVSFTSFMDTLPEFLRKYFSRNNLLIIYPEQFGDEGIVPMMADSLSTDIASAPSPIWLRVMEIYRRGVALRKRFTHRNRQNRIEL